MIPFAPMWAELKRLAKPKAAIVLFGSQPFTSALVMSNPQWFRYEWVWVKSQGSNFANLDHCPMREHENIIVLSDKTSTYNPQRIERSESGKSRKKYPHFNTPANGVMGQTYRVEIKTDVDTRCPSSVLYFNNEKGLHPTQKPVALMEYLIHTYTNEGDAVLDFTMGSGTTMVACVNTKRNGTGIEKDAGYYAIAERRVKEAQAQMRMPQMV